MSADGPSADPRWVLSLGSDASWRHYRLAHGQVEPLVEREDLDEALAEALVAAGARPRVQRLRGGLLAVLRGVNLNPGADPEDMVSVRAWVEPGRIVTVCPRRTLAVQDVRTALESGADDAPCNPAEVFIAVASALAGRIGPVVDELDEEVDELQERLLADGPARIQHELSELRRTVTLLRRHLAPQRDAIVWLSREPVSLFDEEDVVDVREVADRLMRYVEDLESVRERAAVLQDETDHVVSMRMNRNMYVMSVIAAVFLPLGFVTGLLGINVGGVPGTESAFAFWVVTIGLVLLSLFEIWLLRRIKVL